MKHIYTCEKLNNDESYKKNPYEEIFSDNIRKQLEISRIFFKNCENMSHVIQRDPLYSVMEYSNGL